MSANSDAIRSAMRSVSLIAAARQDANPEQLRRLKAALAPFLRDSRRILETDQIREKLAAVMGKDWKPTGEWAQGATNPMPEVEMQARARGFDLFRLGL